MKVDHLFQTLETYADGHSHKIVMREEVQEAIVLLREAFERVRSENDALKLRVAVLEKTLLLGAGDGRTQGPGAPKGG